MLQLRNYVPLLKTGVAEIEAYRALYPDVKDSILPVFLARPWPNASHFNFTIEKLREAVEDHPFGFALDSDRFRHVKNTRPAQREFDALFDSRAGYAGYYDVVSSFDNAVPVLIPTSDADTLLRQIGNAEQLDRGLIIHQRRSATIPLSSLIVSLPPLPHDTVVIVDAGWSRNYLDLESWAMPVLERAAAALPDAEIVIMSSSFPDSFTHIVGDLEELGTERRLFAAARQRFQQIDLTFGDWASTRPTQGGGGAPIPSRIDVAKPASWHIFRANPDDDRGFPELAWSVQHHECLAEAPDCWGKETILVTDDSGAGIATRPIATQVRINMHMTIQSGASSVPPMDEVPYED